ncbi:TPA: hypothetical protein ACH1K7_001969 [Proteus mirabilis]|nr:hypothetical protein [Proteus mirabilis]
MHIPSYRVSEEMHSTSASVWYVPAIDSESPFAILIKAPTSSIKAIISQCKVNLVFAKELGVLCKGIRIHDMPDSPIMFYDIQRHHEDHLALINILNKGIHIPVFIYNEMDWCLAWTYASLEKEKIEQTIDLIGDINLLHNIDDRKEISRILDCFVFTTDKSQNYDNTHLINLSELDIYFETWNVIDNSLVGLNESYSVTIDDKNEGETFEKAAWASIESIFPLSIYKSPNVIVGEKKRELTDILAYCNEATFLIEVKDISILQAGFNRDSDRKTKGVQKQIKKAIQQLIGAVGSLNKNYLIMDSNDKKIKIINSDIKHCVVLVTEIMEYGDWSEIYKSIVLASKNSKAFFHVMDFREFVLILKSCNGNIKKINTNLIERFDFSLKKESVMIRCRITDRD